MNKTCTALTLIAALALAPVVLARTASQPALVSRLLQAAPNINPDALALAVDAMDCATQQAAERPARRLAVIDYSKPSAEQRLWVFDLTAAKLLYAERVAHGAATGDNLSQHFSNKPGSHQSSLGLFRTSETYQGANGYSLR
ncbi:MAG: murein L,D-transpeptidase catalytic domain family protein, partial [Nevskiaceae bacterium]|nr:murein L,D-transpeptidase catalytic domain family protein [Nevskiaceae bacterium]